MDAGFGDGITRCFGVMNTRFGHCAGHGTLSEWLYGLISERSRMRYQLGANPGARRVLHLEGCRLAKIPYRMLDGLITDEQVIGALGASLEWTDGCERCAPKLRRKIVSARRYLASAHRS